MVRLEGLLLRTVTSNFRKPYRVGASENRQCASELPDIYLVGYNIVNTTKSMNLFSSFPLFPPLPFFVQ